MKVVLPAPDTAAPGYRVVLATACVSGVLCLVVGILLIANRLAVNRLDPVHSPALARLVERLRATPQDAALREEIRDLDLLARRAFFSSQHFTRTATILLLGSAVVLAVSLKAIATYRQPPPIPTGQAPADDLAATAAWARRSVAVVGLVLAGFALSLALPWQSPLDDARFVAGPEVGAGARKPVAAAVVGQAGSTAAPVADAGGVTSPAPGVAAASGSAGRVELPAAVLPASGHSAVAIDPGLVWSGFLGGPEGPIRDGVLPGAWNRDSGQGVAWKVAVPLPGMSSPVVWNDRVFITGADAKRREVYAFATATGRCLWTTPVPPVAGSPASPPKVTEDTGYAASTVAADGRHVAAIFATGDLAVFDMEGRLLWQRALGLPENAYGYASSPVLFEGVVIVQFDRKQDSFLAALDAATGTPRWRVARSYGASWASPRLARTAQGPLLLTAATPDVVAYNPHTGSVLWRVECLKDAEVAVSPVYADGRLWVAAEGILMAALDTTTRAVLWRVTEPIPAVSTPIVTSDGILIVGLGEGGIVGLDAATGSKLWEEETEAGVYASPVMAGGSVCVIDREGNVRFFKPTRKGYGGVGDAKVGESVFATPAVAGGRLIVRGTKHLFAFGP